ncbi:MAG: redoxin [Methylobacter sp.]|nr:MAG: redoxin [Methylobacter sp.]
MNKIGLYLLTALFALACGILANNYRVSSKMSDPVQMPAFKLPDPEGKWHHSSEWQGKIRIINFWATWCPPCRKEIPEFVALQAELTNQGVVFIGIAIDEEKAVKNYQEDMAINYPVLVDNATGVELAREFGDSMDAVPFTVIVNREGQIVFRKPGEVTRDELMSQIDPLLKPQK